MEPIALITPTRDRPKMLEFCKYQVRQFNVPHHHIVIDHLSMDNGIDISERVLSGTLRALELGIDFVFICEDDDAYPIDYLSRFGDISDCDFIGCEHTHYYHLGNRSWNKISHPNRSSLFTTGFRISALKDFVFPANTPFVDIKLWYYANTTNKRIKFIKDTGAIGIKAHGEGTHGGKGHSMTMKNKDPHYKWLQDHVTKEAYEFYLTL